MELTCINCPLGRTINILKEGDRILVEGNSCPRGEKYARDELLQPKRMLTSTIYAIFRKSFHREKSVQNQRRILPV